MFGMSDGNTEEQQEDSSSTSSERKKIKVDKKNKKRKALEDYRAELRESESKDYMRIGDII